MGRGSGGAGREGKGVIEGSCPWVLIVCQWGIVVVHRWGGSCCPWAWVLGHCLWVLVFFGWEGCCLWVTVVICGSWVLFFGAGSLFVDPRLSTVGHGVLEGGRLMLVGRLFVGVLFVGWDVVCGCSVAMLCVVCSLLVELDGTSMGGILTIVHNLNNNNE